MARKKADGRPAAFTMFNVAYEDGTITSNRRVANELLDQSFGDKVLDLARTAIQQQDNDIAARSGQRRAKIKAVTKVRAAWRRRNEVSEWPHDRDEDEGNHNNHCTPRRAHAGEVSEAVDDRTTAARRG